ncbi:hypothetical protein PPNSA23_40280 [Phyllobacterium phragmitis]|uniref:Transcriptional regulator n=1 Tax=Phyllobacterium phragmitis TaxID=2670329 RepID=A0ABQ0H591_9HYPH
MQDNNESTSPRSTFAKRDDTFKNTNNSARAIIEAELQLREEKTRRLREARLAREPALSPPTPSKKRNKPIAR